MTEALRPQACHSCRIHRQAEIRRLKAELKRVTEERDIPKKAAAYFAKESEQGMPSSGLMSSGFLLDARVASCLHTPVATTPGISPHSPHARKDQRLLEQIK